MQLANIIVQRERNNRIFQPGAGPNGGEFFLPWRQLRDRFSDVGYELNTPDVNAGRLVAFEFHLNAQRRLSRGTPLYTFLYEDPLVRPLNADRAQLLRYRRVFTWNEALHDRLGVVPLEYPNDLRQRELLGFDARDLWCVMIASNKALRHADSRSLHSARISTIRCFEAHAPHRFALYGAGWDIPAVHPGAWGRLLKRLNEWRYGGSAKRPFPSWQGRIGRKAEVLDRARFAICFENARGSRGYITEKIFDCFTSGCVPVYIGSPRDPRALPPDTYIDGDQFAHSADMLAFLESIDAAQFAQYQRAMRRFLASPSSARFSNAHFCDVLVREITADLAR